MDKRLQDLLEKIKKYNPNVKEDLIIKAYEIAENAHKEQKRISGLPYIEHPVQVASIVADMEMDVESICAALLHDVVEDTDYTKEDLEEIFGKNITELVDGVTKLEKIAFSSKEERDMENLRKMFLAMAKDIRVIIIKFADRLHNLSTLISMSEEKQREKARETLSIFAPLAHRLGMYKIKWELEDLSLKYIDPVAYHEIVEGISQKRHDREQFIATIKMVLKEKLEESNIDCVIDGRPKHFYSIYRKMFTQNKTLDQIYDLFAVRIVTNTVSDCYTALGIAHEMYTPMPGRFKDYIAMPKPNMYQSLHTTVIGPNGIPFEIQIRTKEMHEIAEKGIAAHWKYKEGGKGDDKIDQKLTWVRQLLEIQNDVRDEEDFLNALKIDLFTDQVFVFTPKGDVVSFPAGATPIDFAFNIHSAIGCKMQGARVNGKIVPLDYNLQNGDIVEIITSATIHGPSRDWLKIVKTTNAKNKINQWFKKENREENIIRGKEAITAEIKKQGFQNMHLTKMEYLEPLLKRYGFLCADDLYSTIGYGGMPVIKVVARLHEEYKKRHPEPPSMDIIEQIGEGTEKKGGSKNAEGISVEGVQGCLVRFAGCCNPVPGDKIIGYITRGRGVSIHRQDCVNISLAYGDEEEKARLIDVSWERNMSSSYHANLKVVGHDREGMLLEITTVIANEKISLKSLNARSTKDMLAIIDAAIEISNTDQLNSIIKKLRNIEGVIDVTRSTQ